MSQEPVEREVQIVNRAGLHARPAAEFVKIAGRYTASIRVEKDGLEVNGKSIMGVLMLAAHRESFVSVRAEGPDASEAVDAIGELIADKFEEAE